MHMRPPCNPVFTVCAHTAANGMVMLLLCKKVPQNIKLDIKNSPLAS